MSNHLSNIASKDAKVNWDTAISDAEEMIRKLRVRITELKVAIKVFKERRDEGDPFPGQSEVNQDESN